LKHFSDRKGLRVKRLPLVTDVITVRLRAGGESPEAVLKRLREQLTASHDTTLEEIKIKPATKRGGDK
jgi:hypothetical protein